MSRTGTRVLGRSGWLKLASALVLTGLLGMFGLFGCSSGNDADKSQAQLLYEDKCNDCHSLSRVEQADYQGVTQWREVVNQMLSTSVSSADVDQIAGYLAESHAK